MTCSGHDPLFLENVKERLEVFESDMLNCRPCFRQRPLLISVTSDPPMELPRSLTVKAIGVTACATHWFC